MNTKSAQKKAVEIWGLNGTVSDNKKPTMLNGVQLTGRYRVGRIELGMFFSVKGDGDSWESAFESAARREKVDKERMAHYSRKK